MIKKHEIKYYVGVIVVIIAIFTLPTHKESNLDKEYCDMVELYEETDGEYGWPDYETIYKDTCAEYRK